MLSPRVKGGADPGEFNIFTRARPQSQTPTPRYHFFPKTGCSYVKLPTPGQNPNV